MSVAFGAASTASMGPLLAYRIRRAKAI